MSRPVYCGHDHAGHGCVQLATVLIEGGGRARLACPGHTATVTAWVRGGGGQVTTTPVTQPVGAVAGHGQATLFDEVTG